MLDNYSDIITIDELTKICRIGRNTAYKLVRNNVIKHIRIGRKILIPKKYLIDFLQSNT